jgi:hypothetical protein
MAIALDQTGSNSLGTIGTSLAITWAAGPASGSAGAAIISFDGDPGTITPPSGWAISGVTLNSTGGTHQCYAAVFTTVDASTAGTSWSWVNNVKATVAGVSYTGAAGGLEKLATNTGNSSTLTTGNGTTTVANEVLIALFAQTSGSIGGTTFSAPTNSFGIEVQVAVGGIGSTPACGISDRIVAATGTYSTGVTSSDSDSWVVEFISFEISGAGFDASTFPHYQTREVVFKARASVVAY